jgi:protein-disulfide isomerase
MHDGLFSNQPRLDETTIRGLADQLGLNPPRFDDCLASPVDKRVEEQVRHARSLDINGTPTFLIGRIEGNAVRVEKVLSGAQPLGAFQRTIDELLIR